MLTECVDGLERPPGQCRLLSVRDTTDHLRVSAATVYSLVARQELRSVRISNAIRIHPDDLAVYISRRK